MPVTPFHFGPAAIVKAVTPRHFSFVAFGCTQIVIDAEPLFYMLKGLWPIHRFLHTYLGATIVALFVVLFGKPVCEWVLRLWNSRLSEAQFSWLGVNPQIPLIAAATGALLGSYSHVFVDSIMHSDMQPLAPFSQANPFLHVLPIGHLHMLCAMLGVAGGTALLIRAVRRKLIVARAGCTENSFS